MAFLQLSKTALFKPVRFVMTLILLLGLLWSLPPASQAQPSGVDSHMSPFGINLDGVVDWTNIHPFTNHFKASRQWIPQCEQNVDPGCSDGWDTGERALLDLDEHGWVRSLPAPEDDPVYTSVGTLMFVGDERAAFGGEYLVLYDGTGTLEYGLGATKNEAASTPGRDVVNLEDSGMFLLQITETDPQNTNDYLRNIRVVRPADEATYATQIFNPAFLDKIEPFRVLRFMDWMRTNDSEQGVWAERPLATDSTYATDAGVPLEIMLALVNHTGQDPWFTLPHLATDNYITSFAELVHDQLNPFAKVYIEYSNETWNGQFDQADYVRAQGAALFTSGDAFQQGINWHGLRTAQMCDLWKAAWGADADRVVCVMGSQAANSWVGEQALTCPLWTEGAPCVDHGIDALAIAPYFGGYLGSSSNEAEVQAWTNEADGGLNSLFAELTTGGEITGGPTGGGVERALGWITANRTIADQEGVSLIAYEGGQHLSGNGGVENNQAIVDLFIAANRDPRMEAVYTTYLNGWRTNGGELFVHFSLAGNYTKWGSWGALEYINQPGSPKYDALTDFIEQNPCWWAGCAATVQYSVSIPMLRR